MHPTFSSEPALPLPEDGRVSRVIAWVRLWLERCGIALFSRPALNRLDRKLAALLPQRNGFFVEAGANDGFRQSNSYYLSRFRGWRGILVEPMPHLASLCRKTRQESTTVCCALGAPETSGQMVALRHAGLMSHVSGILSDDAGERKRAKAGQLIQGMPAHDVIVHAPVRTLTDVLAEAAAPLRFDLLSLDVEGYEVEVLRGLDLNRYRPQGICVEVRHGNRDAVAAILSPHYTMAAVLHQAEDHADYFWRATSGT